MQITSIKHDLMVGKDWAAIAKAQENILACNKLDGKRLQGLLDTFEHLVEREADQTVQEKAWKSNDIQILPNVSDLTIINFELIEIKVKAANPSSDERLAKMHTLRLELFTGSCSLQSFCGNQVPHALQSRQTCCLFLQEDLTASSKSQVKINVWKEVSDRVYQPFSDFAMELDATHSAESLQLQTTNGEALFAQRFKLQVQHSGLN